MLVKIKSIEEINKYNQRNNYPSPGFVSEELFSHNGVQHSMEYYCGKIIELDEKERFDGWIWDSWMFEKVPRSLDIE